MAGSPICCAALRVRKPLPDRPRGLPHVAVETVEGGDHFFPMLKADVARDALFDAAV